MKLLMVLIGFAALSLPDLPGLIKKKLWHDLIIYVILFVLLLILGVLMAAGVKIPSPIKAIQAFYQKVLHLSFK